MTEQHIRSDFSVYPRPSEQYGTPAPRPLLCGPTVQTQKPLSHIFLSHPPLILIRSDMPFALFDPLVCSSSTPPPHTHTPLWNTVSLHKHPSPALISPGQLGLLMQLVVASRPLPLGLFTQGVHLQLSFKLSRIVITRGVSPMCKTASSLQMQQQNPF